MQNQLLRQLPVRVVSTVFLLILSSPHTYAEEHETELRKEINELKMIIKRQREQLNSQSELVQKLDARLKNVEFKDATDTSTISGDSLLDTSKAGSNKHRIRDSVGDLNANAVKAGDFAGAIMLPNTREVQLAIGGFVKTAVLWDSDADNLGVDFLPSLLNDQNEQDGSFALDSTLTRLLIDVRAPTDGDGQLRGYLEWDLNDNNNGSPELKTRLAYGSWTTPAGTITAGQNWSTFMDLKLLPEGLTEPTVSGAIFVRQSQIQWSAPLGDQWTYHAAIEDPSSNDFDSDMLDIVRKSRLPDVVLGIEYNNPQWHWRLNSILRKLEFDIPGGSNDSATGWGLSASGRYNFSSGDWLGASASYGEGLGRYLLGIRSTAGGAVESPTSALELRDNWGGFINYFHKWSETTRSTITLGHAKADALDFQPGTTFESTSYGSVNFLWSALPYLTLGAEYQYGTLEFVDGNDIDNNRISFAVQIF
ncbi:DcaP family trimeric outer membrane transporter [Shewanella spartinae]|uniref:DcaP family trimeric outer membrane transporter n=1 Tax=Shewanella spartinae TaxID=2864205 RepID=UPI001C65EF68|nr:DcaP family trimeric outer membrane transporter [Shewanella spartinae]QYJ93631.1 hypothetical protein K0I31_18975 [Shewanella spartinae]